jgi:hypothetical protein
MTVFQIMMFALSLCFLVIVICTIIDTIQTQRREYADLRWKKNHRLMAEMRLRHPNTKFDLKD